MRLPGRFAIPGVTPDRGRGGVAFTLIELLIVIGIIGILAVTSLPAIRSLTQVNTQASGERQVLDDLALARQRAINNRRTVYIVFTPPNVGQHLRAVQNSRDPDRQRAEILLRTLFDRQYASYALFSRKSVGDQPGRQTPQYLTDWNDLPGGMLFLTNRFVLLGKSQWESASASLSLTNRPLAYGVFPFPTAASPLIQAPYIAFDAQGRIFYDDDRKPARPGEAVSLARGSAFYQRDVTGAVLPDSVPDVALSPPTNRVDILVNWLTGRAEVQTYEMP